MMDAKNIIDYWQTLKIKNEADLELVLDDFGSLFAYHSAKIENDEISFERINGLFSDGKVNSFSDDPRTIFEEQNQKVAYDFLKNKIINKTPLTEEFIKEVHHILTGGTYDYRRFIDNGERPGEYKKHNYVTGINEVGSLPEDVGADISGMLAVLNDYEGKDVLKLAAYLHARFEYIHPFADGNGRVGRTIMNYFLMIHNYPPIIVYEDDRVQYYQALEKYDTEEQLEPLYLYLQMELIKTWEKKLQRANN
jgi:Fic family protein